MVDLFISSSLPVSCVCSGTVTAFKNRVKQCNLDNFLFYTDALTMHVDV